MTGRVHAWRDGEGRLSAPATERNRGPILEVLERVLPRPGRVLEVASGTGEHAVFFARSLPGVEWAPSDPDPDHRASIAAWTEHLGVGNVAAPLALDVRGAWPDGPFDAVFCANMIHIAPWEACLGLLAGTARTLRPGGPLVMYGPYMRDGAHTAPSNAAFDASLRQRDPSWGVRDLGDVVAVAASHGLALEAVVEMPANNLTVVYRRG